MGISQGSEWGNASMDSSLSIKPAAAGTRRILLIIGGTFFTGLGILGMLLPLLPSTCFLLLAAACYAKSSAPFYDWLLNNRWFGTSLRNYRLGRGIPAKTKVWVLGYLWVTLTASGLWLIDKPWLPVLLIVIGAAVTLHLLTIPTFSAAIRDDG